ncbi:MAG: nitroreductase family protein [Muribaculaceae bacterium]|nr:nitroreductase family protein [Muribaculaceae bacterium]
MKNKGFLIIILAIGLVIVSYKWVESLQKNHPTENETIIKNTTFDDIMSRTSVRAYSDKDVTAEQVDTLLKAAMAAPTAGNKQPWRFVVIRNKEVLTFISEEFGSMKMMKEAKVAIVVCGDVTATFPGEGQDYWIEDTSAATENLLLAAHSIGLGAVWCGIYPMKDRVKIFSEMLHLPKEILPLGCIAIGYPEGETIPKDKWKPENVHYESWDSVPATLIKK